MDMRMGDNGGRLYAGYKDAYVGYDPDLLLIEGSYGWDDKKPERIIHREYIEDVIRKTPRVTTVYSTGPVASITTIEEYAIPPELVEVISPAEVIVIELGPQKLPAKELVEEKKVGIGAGIILLVVLIMIVGVAGR